MRNMGEYEIRCWLLTVFTDTQFCSLQSNIYFYETPFVVESLNEPHQLFYFHDFVVQWTSALYFVCLFKIGNEPVKLKIVLLITTKKILFT